MPKSVMVHSFSQVPSVDIPRSTFQRDHGKKLTLDCDYIVPVLVDDIIPGDTFNVNANFVARLASPTVLPLMDNLFIEFFFFFIPYRLVWDNWEKFMGAQTDPGDSIDYTIPVLSGVSAAAPGELGDYMGLPAGYTPAQMVTCSALPFRCYHLVWDEWFRDQNLQDSFGISTDDGPDDLTESQFSEVPKKRAKRHDYFTSGLPWPQKGTAVSLPLGTTAPVILDSPGIPEFDATGLDGGLVTAEATTGNLSVVPAPSSTSSVTWDTFGFEVDLSSASGATINDLRLAYQTQRLLERDARSGTRYVETIKAHFGVDVPDFRLQRPEFLGGGSTRVNVSPVAQTTYQGTQTLEDAKGALAGIGTASGSHGFTKSFVEHGLLLGLVNVRGDITYSQGIERYWDKQTRYDFYFPVLSQIGEQAVLNREIYFANESADDDVFSYQERYAEYRYKPSSLAGLMRPSVASDLAEFHLSEEFSSRPSLDSTFIESNTGAPLDRALSVPSQPHFVMDVFFDMRCVRPMPLFGVPGNVDHF